MRYYQQQIGDISANLSLSGKFALAIHKLKIYVIGIAQTSMFSYDRMYMPVVNVLSFSLQISFETSFTLMGLKLKDGPERFSSMALVLGSENVL